VLADYSGPIMGNPEVIAVQKLASRRSAPMLKFRYDISLKPVSG
jgi:hypothetical protein